MGFYYIPQADLKILDSSYAPVSASWDARLPVCATMAALSVAYFKFLTQPNIHLHGDIIVIMASMAHCGAFLLITLWLIIVRAHIHTSRMSVVFILTAESQVVIGSCEVSHVSISRAHLKLQTPTVLLYALQSWTSAITFLECSSLICTRGIKVWVNLYNALRMLLLEPWNPIDAG